MTKAKAFESATLTSIADSIEKLAKKHEITGVSITSHMAGYTVYYDAIVLYEE